MQPFSESDEDSPQSTGPARRKRAAPDSDAPGRPDFVTALARGLAVLRCFQPGVRTLGNQELARLTELPKATVSRLTFTLTELGYLRYHADTGRYSPGYGVLALGFGLLAGLEVRELARNAMQQLARKTGGAVALGALDGDAMVYLEAVHGSSALYLRLPVGYRASLGTAMGRAHLAGLPRAQRDALLAGLGQAAPPAAAVARAVDELANEGCCYAVGEWQPGINAVAVPFTAITGEGRFVLSCGGPDTLLPEAELRGRIAGMLRRTAAQLSGPGGA
ncbi:IclR family transcriptional regulator [Bordetella genomosp. 13]|uniref:IclR family transcriptional regulator n=1 Tax=Bordetella genomosp. 13 TaxID=463040 RepID=A0A1W6ZE68_9BORD|nr:IclR family transcriptional regulator [Bordetella genomosp. 13]ARP95619.1 IclR family transcriptional regulator [Bordetella genomosp. 13]